MLSRGAVEILPEFLWRIVMKLPEFNLFFVKSAQIFLIFPKHLPEFPWFSKIWGGAVAPPPVSYAYG